MSLKPIARIVVFAVALILLGGAAGALALTSGGIAGIRDNEVSDVETARQFLAQEIDLFLPERDSDVAGAFQYMVVPGELVIEFQAAQQVKEVGWLENPPATAVVISWTSADVTFQVPRPRPGVDATLTGDTFLLIVVPGEGRKITAVLSSKDLAPLELGAVTKVNETLTLSSQTN